MKTSISVRPEGRKLYLILLVRNNLKVLFLIFVLYQLFEVRTRAEIPIFHSPASLYNRISTIGWCFLVIFNSSQFTLDWCDCFLLPQYQTGSSVSTAINNIEGLQVEIFPFHDFSFEGFFTGLLLIIFSILMKRSSEIEKDWSLTI